MQAAQAERLNQGDEGLEVRRLPEDQKSIMSKRERILLRVERGALVPADAHSQQRLGLMPSPEPRGLFAVMNPPAKRDPLTQDLFADKDQA